MAALVDAGISVAQAAEAVRSGDRWEPPTPAAVQVRAESPLVGELVEAARALDTDRVDHILITAPEQLGWGTALMDVVVPALRRVGDEWASGRFTPAQEHLLSEALRLRLYAAIAAVSPAAGAPIVVMACPEDELHDLGLLSLRLLLRQAGTDVRYLGADVPAGALVQAVEQLRPEAVVLSGTGTASEPAIALVARDLLQTRWRGQVFFGGSAVRWTGGLGIPGELLPESLVDTAAMIRAYLERQR
jgi:methanogenic corrinoid protein MtbC1